MLVESSFGLNDPGVIKRVIEYAACAFGDHWEAQVHKEFVTEFADIVVAAIHRESEKNNGKQKELKKKDPNSGNKSNSSADSALVLSIGCAAAYLVNMC